MSNHGSQDTLAALQANFANNMAFLKDADPGLYEQFRDYHPEKLHVVVDADGALNLHHMDEQSTPVYPSNPWFFTQQAVENYIKAPLTLNFNFEKTPEKLWGPKTHAYQCNRAAEILAELPCRNFDALPETTPFMLIQGVGLGYHIGMLMDRTRIENLCLIEPEPDYFYASLATIDWPAIYKHFERDGNNLILVVGQNKEQSVQSIKMASELIGLHNLAKPLIFNHIHSTKHHDILNEVIHDFSTSLSYNGFFEDEAVSLAHTLENLKNGVPALRTHALLNNRFLDAPAIIVANGPSLDLAADFLKQNGESAVIFSCGTALGSLLDMGVKPDIHIEMERLRITPEWIERYTSAEQRDGINFMALNTVHPDTFGLFGRSAMLLKNSDIGTAFIGQQATLRDEIPTPPWCNPTVGNTALALTGALGFKQIYLVGLDLAYGAEEQHHSRHSRLHQEVSSAAAETKTPSTSDKEVIQEQGNFRAMVTTTRLWRTAKASAEQCIKLNEGCNYFNLSDGVRLEGATPLALEAVQITPLADKARLVDKIFQQHCAAIDIDLSNPRVTLNNLTPTLQLCVQLIELHAATVHSVEEARQRLNTQHQLLQGLRDTPLNHQLMRGSVETFATVMNLVIQNSGPQREKQDVERLNRMRLLYTDFLGNAAKSIDHALLAVDSKSLDQIIS